MKPLVKSFFKSCVGLVILLGFGMVESKQLKSAAGQAVSQQEQTIPSASENVEEEPTKPQPSKRVQRTGQKDMPSSSKTITKSTVTVNGQSVSCDGTVRFIDGEFFCNGKKIKPSTTSSAYTRDLTSEETQNIIEQSRAVQKRTEEALKKSDYTTRSSRGSGNKRTVSSTVTTINGQNVPCNGSVTVINDEVFCNGKKILPKK